MKPEMQRLNPDLLVDVASATEPRVSGILPWVGMEQVASPVLVKAANGPTFAVPGLVDMGVSLARPDVRGIHMSRLFGLVQDGLMAEELSFLALKRLVARMVECQGGISDRAELKVAVSLPIKRRALVSSESGWRQYPVEYRVRQENGHTTVGYKLEILYSSTCPCSAALALDSFLKELGEEFSGSDGVQLRDMIRWIQERGWVATPHAQRSRAVVDLEFAQAEFAPEPIAIINDLEEALGTAVQAAVKRVDEQEFARRNASQQMFCEDAARILKQTLARNGQVTDFHIKVEHQESLHAHNAVAYARK